MRSILARAVVRLIVLSLAYSFISFSLSYLKYVAGPRTVPVELGSRYTDQEWSQKLMTISEFIDNYVTTNQVHS